MIINHYGSTPETGMGGRQFYLAAELAKQGHDVYLVVSSYTHLLRAPRDFDGKYLVESVDGVKIVWLRTTRYPSAHSKRRIVSWFIFAWRLRLLSRLVPNRPDVVICSVPALVSFLGAERLARKHGARLIFEERDLWPLTLVELGGYSPRHPFIRFLQWIENRAYRVSDRVVSNLPRAVDHMVARGMAVEKFACIPNGIRLDEVSAAEPMPPEVRRSLPDSRFIVGYAGTVGEANALDVFIDAADHLRDRPDIAFVIVGSGKNAHELLRRTRELELDNVVFIPAVPKRSVQAVLESFDVCYVGYRNSSLYRYGIGANKLPEYLYASRPVILGVSGVPEDVVTASGGGVVVPAADPRAVADAVVELAQLSDSERHEMGRRGREYVLQNLDYALLARELAAAALGPPLRGSVA